MQLHQYIETLTTPRRKEAFFARLAEARGQSVGKAQGYHPVYIMQLSAHLQLPDGRRPSHQLALDIEAASFKRVRRWELRPDIWAPPPRPRKRKAGQSAAA